MSASLRQINLTQAFFVIQNWYVRHGGIVNQISGNGLMALFGLTAEKDNPHDGVIFAALDMIDTLKKFDEKRAVAAKVQLQIGIGIASGIVSAEYAGTQHCIGLFGKDVIE